MTWYQDGFDKGFEAGRTAHDLLDSSPVLVELNEEIRALCDGRFGHLSLSSTPNEIIQAALDLIRGVPR